MLKVLIVDDEKNIRLGIQAMINREFPGQFHTSVASDGLEALENMEEVDILITDIRMPRMDGIKLIQELQGWKNKPVIVILSGYDDFEYTREAIKNQVKDYLLKPVNRNDLFQALRNISEDITRRNIKENEQLDEFRTNQLNYIFLSPFINEYEISKRCQQMKLDMFENGYYVGRLQYDSRIDTQMDPISQLIARLDFMDKDTFLYFIMDDHVVILTEKEEDLQEIAAKISESKNLFCSLGISSKQTNLSSIKEAHNQATDVLKYKFLFPRRKAFYHDHLSGKKDCRDFPIEEIKKISNMLGTDREKELKSLLLKVLDFEKISQYSMQYMEQLSKEINKLIFENFFSKLGDESIETFKLFSKLGDIYRFESFYQYFQAVEELLNRVHEYIKQMKAVYSEQKYMEKAISYIKENFHKDLNLAVVSNYISLNYSYFSHMFKEYTGLNFVDYLKAVRIEKAKQLLSETDLKVFEVSELVGYKNPKQFARVFREIEGISPKEYREQI